MLRMVEGFEYTAISDMPANGWALLAASNSLIPGRVAGNALMMKSTGRGFFLNTFFLSEVYSGGTLGLAVAFNNSADSLGIVFYSSSQEQYRVTLTGRGTIHVSGYGKQLAKTGSVFIASGWSYFEICFTSKNGMTVAVNGNPILMISNVFCSFNDIGLSLPYNQTSGVMLDDMFFDDVPAINGNRVVFPVGLVNFPYVPAAIYGVKVGTDVQPLNSDRPWTFREVTKLNGDLALISGNSVSSPIQHSSITQ